MDKKIAILLCMCAILIVSIFIYYTQQPQIQGRIERSFPLQIQKVAYSFPWLNVTWLAVADVEEPIVGYEVYYEDRLVANEDQTPFELYQEDKLTISLPFENEVPSGSVINVKLLLGSQYCQTFQITVS